MQNGVVINQHSEESISCGIEGLNFTVPQVNLLYKLPFAHSIHGQRVLSLMPNITTPPPSAAEDEKVLTALFTQYILAYHIKSLRWWGKIFAYRI